MTPNPEVLPQTHPEHLLTLDERALALDGAMQRLGLAPLDISEIKSPEDLNAAFSEAGSIDEKIVPIYLQECKVPRKPVPDEAIKRMNEELRIRRHEYAAKSPLHRFATIVLDTLGVRPQAAH